LKWQKNLLSGFWSHFVDSSRERMLLSEKSEIH
jgi:hypothetical protein